jgi:uncharacterized protein (TIGR00255 family)
MRSMTGFASHAAVISGVKTTIELKSVNHRFLDIYIKMPRAFSAFEAEIRKSIQNYITRGKVSLAITCDNSYGEEMRLNQPVLSSIIRALKSAQKEYKFLGDIHSGDLLRIPNLFTTGEESKISQVAVRSLQKEVEQALIKFIKMREKEGQQLEKDIRKRLQFIKDTAVLIDNERQSFMTNAKKKMCERIKALIEEVAVSEDRLMKEVAFLLEKVDITEELVRLQAHLKLFCDLLAKKEKYGKDLDFITQEMNREVNTIASKAQDFAIAHHVIKIKSEIEKIREQLQNVE